MKEEDIIRNRIPCDGLDTGCSGRRGCGTTGCKMNYDKKFDAAGAAKKMQELKKESWITNVKRIYGWTSDQAKSAWYRIFANGIVECAGCDPFGECGYNCDAKQKLIQ
jgi:hypothetical protein